MKRALTLSVLAGLLAGVLMISGCNSGNREVAGGGEPSGESKGSEAPPPTNTPTGEETGGMPDLHAPEKVLAVDQAKKEHDAAKKVFDAKKDDAKLKDAYVKATVNLADAYMFNDALPPREKYRNALQFYREVLKTDSKNEHAMAAKTTIEEIYKSMGRPVPGEGG